jgi:hypothetical protein
MFFIFLIRIHRETLNKSAFYGEPAQLCDAGINKINALTRLILPQKFTHLFNQRFHRSLVKNILLSGLVREGKTSWSTNQYDRKLIVVTKELAGIEFRN